MTALDDARWFLLRLAPAALLLGGFLVGRAAHEEARRREVTGLVARLAASDAGDNPVDLTAPTKTTKEAP